MKPPYKHPTVGSWFTEALFWDRMYIKAIADRNTTIDPVFSLYADKPGLINCRKTFVALRDPTGYTWAIQYLGDWQHWLKLIKCKWFAEAYDIWVEELKNLLRAEALERIADIASSQSPQSLNAAKYLAGFEWEKKAGTRGRPSKADLDKELHKQAELLKDESSDFERIGLVVSKT